MTLNEFRSQLESYRRAVDVEAASLKDSYLALERLENLYLSFDTEERRLADQVLSEWVSSDDVNVRFDALYLVRRFRISLAAPALRGLAERLRSSTLPGAPDELEKVERILHELVQNLADMEDGRQRSH